jgi:hypothetical protein
MNENIEVLVFANVKKCWLFLVEQEESIDEKTYKYGCRGI